LVAAFHYQYKSQVGLPKPITQKGLEFSRRRLLPILGIAIKVVFTQMIVLFFVNLKHVVGKSRTRNFMIFPAPEDHESIVPVRVCNFCFRDGAAMLVHIDPGLFNRTWMGQIHNCPIVGSS
jgi:hypothetical protein